MSIACETPKGKSFGNKNYPVTKNTTSTRVTKPDAVGPFAMVPLAVASDPGLSPGAKILFGMILSLTKGPWGRCFAGNEKLAEMTGLCLKQVVRLLRELEKRGMIFRVMEGNRRLEIKATWTPAQGQDVPTHEDNLSLSLGQNVPAYEIADEIAETSTTATVARMQESKTVVDSVPEAVVEQVACIVSPRVAEEVKTHPTQFFTAAGGNWANLLAGARSVRAAQNAGRRITNPVGFLDTQTRLFASQGIPEKFKPPPKVVVVPPPKPVETTPEDDAKTREAIAQLHAQYPTLGRLAAAGGDHHAR